MKQKITVRAVIKEDGKVLLVRRALGGSYKLGKYELPGSRLEWGEQPQDALRRVLRDELGVTPETMQLIDFMGYQESEQPDVHRVAAAYLTSLSPDDRDISLNKFYDKYVWKKLSEIQLNEITDGTAIILKLHEQVVVTDKDKHIVQPNDEKTSTIEQAIIYTDGGSRGNPGPSASGFVIMNSNEEVLVEGGKYLGITTNNQAEYQAVYLALAKAYEMGVKRVEFRIDSLLVVNQMNGVYKIKNRDLWPIHSRIKELINSFEKVTFTHVRREFNKLADGMVNKTLDSHQ